MSDPAESGNHLRDRSPTAVDGSNGAADHMVCQRPNMPGFSVPRSRFGEAHDVDTPPHLA